MGEKKELPPYFPERGEVIKEITEEVLEVITKKYKLSALTFKLILEQTEKEGLKRAEL